jgi:hypothetical protein
MLMMVMMLMMISCAAGLQSERLTCLNVI